jgi:hypothetical protein
MHRRMLVHSWLSPSRQMLLGMPLLHLICYTFITRVSKYNVLYVSQDVTPLHAAEAVKCVSIMTGLTMGAALALPSMFLLPQKSG